MTLRCSSCNHKLMEFIEGRAIIKCRCGTVNILVGESTAVVRSVGEEVRGQTVGETARYRDHRELGVERGVVVGGVQESRAAQHSTIVF